MSDVPTVPAWQLVVRFVLELVSLWGLASAIRAHVDGALWGWSAAIVATLVAIIVWATFNVPNDPSRSGRAPVAVNGVTRLGVELAVFGAGAAGLALTQRWSWLLGFGVMIVVHHTGTVPRLRWLVRQRRGGARP